MRAYLTMMLSGVLLLFLLCASAYLEVIHLSKDGLLPMLRVFKPAKDQNRSFFKLTMAFSLAFINLVCYGQEAQKAEVGIHAPRLVVEHWVLNKSDTLFQPGKIYLVEFGGTWCHSCRKKYPLFCRMINKYTNQITVLSIFMETVPQKSTLVKNYLDHLGYKITFPIGLLDNATSSEWIPEGVPVAYIIGKHGYIIWKGDPLDADSVLPDAINRGYTSEQWRKYSDQEQAFNKELKKVYESIQAKRKSVLRTIDSLIKLYPSKTDLYTARMSASVSCDNRLAVKYLEKLLKENIPGLDWTQIVRPLYGWVKQYPEYYELSLKAFDRNIDDAETKWVAAKMYAHRAALHAIVKNYEKAIQDIKISIWDSQEISGYSTSDLEEYNKQLIAYQNAAK